MDNNRIVQQTLVMAVHMETLDLLTRDKIMVNKSRMHSVDYSMVNSE